MLLSFSLLSFPLPFCLLPSAPRSLVHSCIATVLLNYLLLSFPPIFLLPCCFSLTSHFHSSSLRPSCCAFLPPPPVPASLISFLLCLPIPSSPSCLPSFLHSSPRPLSASLFLPPSFLFFLPSFMPCFPLMFRIRSNFIRIQHFRPKTDPDPGFLWFWGFCP